MFRRLLQHLNRPKTGREGAFLIIKSQEGRRTPAHHYISAEQYKRERDVLAKQGIKRIKGALDR